MQQQKGFIYNTTNQSRGEGVKGKNEGTWDKCRWFSQDKQHKRQVGSGARILKYGGNYRDQHTNGGRNGPWEGIKTN